MAATKPARASRGGTTPAWTYLSNHAHVLIYLARRPDATMREAADAIGITERAVQRIISELDEDGVLRRIRNGRRNEYEIDAARPLKHPVESHCSVRELLALINERARRGRAEG